MAVRTRQTYMDLCRSDRPWRGREMEDLVDKIYDVEDKVERRYKEQLKTISGASNASEFNPDGEGYLQKRNGEWVFGEPDFLTKNEADRIYAERDHRHPYYRHAEYHYWDGQDPIYGQSLQGLREEDSPVFAGITAKNLTGGFVKSDANGKLINGTILASDFPPHAVNHQWDGSDPITGQSIAGLRSSDSPTFLNITATSGIRLASAVSGIIKADSAGNMYSGSISSSDLPAHSHPFSQITARTVGLNPSSRIDSGWYEDGVTLVANGWPVNGSWWHLMCVTHSNPTNYFSLQLSADYFAQDFRIRSTNNNGMQAWSTIWTSTNLVGTRNEHNHDGLYLPVNNPSFTGTISGPSVRVTGFSAGFVRSDSSGNLSSSPIIASELPSHASRHQWDGADPIVGQSISGLRASDSPTFTNVSASSRLYAGTSSIRSQIGTTIITSPDGNDRLSIGSSGISSGVIITAPTARLASHSSGFVKTDVNGFLISTSIIESDLPSHATRHHWDGDDPITGQSISGLRTSSSPSFFGLTLGAGALNVSGGAAVDGISGSLLLRPSTGIVRVRVEDSATYVYSMLSAYTLNASNLTGGLVKSSSLGTLSNADASDLPNHATRHQYGGADPIAGQSISGLRTSDSPTFTNLTLSGDLRLTGYSILTYAGSSLFFETSDGDSLMIMNKYDGTMVWYGCYPDINARPLGTLTRRWNLKANDVDNDLELLIATQTTIGASIYQIPSEGNYFRLSSSNGAGYRNYRLPTPSSSIGKEIILFSNSDDPPGQFATIFAPSGRNIYVGLTVVNGTSYLQFGGDRLCYVFHTDGVNWFTK